MQWQSNEQDLESDPRRQRFRSGREQFRETGQTAVGGQSWGRLSLSLWSLELIVMFKISRTCHDGPFAPPFALPPPLALLAARYSGTPTPTTKKCPSNPSPD
jgi:hypothetical protein